MDANNLGLVFGPTLMRASNEEALESIEASQAMIDHEPRIKALMALLIRYCRPARCGSHRGVDGGG